MYSQDSIKQVMLKAKLLLATRKQGVICYCCQNLMTKQSQRSNLPRSKRLKEKLCLELGFTRAGVLVFSSVSHVIHSRCSIFVEGWVNEEKWADNPINILYITYICVVMWVMHYPSNCRWRLAPWVSKLGKQNSLKHGIPSLTSANTITSSRNRRNYVFLGFVSPGTLGYLGHNLGINTKSTFLMPKLAMNLCKQEKIFIV